MDFAAGCLGGVLGTMATHPLDTLRTRQALCGSPLMGMIRQSLRTGGIRGLYMGMASPCLSVGAWKAVVLGTYKAYLGPGGGDAPLFRDVLVASAGAGATGALVIGPVDLVKTRTMTRPCGQGAVTSARDMLRRELTVARGVDRGDLLRGIRILVARDVVGTPPFLCTYEVCFRFFKGSESGDLGHLKAAAMAGMIAGPVGWASCYPVETYRIQQQAAMVQGGHLPFMDWLRGAHIKGGRRLLTTVAFAYRGYPLCGVRSVFQMAITMLVFESVRLQLNPS